MEREPASRALRSGIRASRNASLRYRQDCAPQKHHAAHCSTRTETRWLSGAAGGGGSCLISAKAQSWRLVCNYPLRIVHESTWTSSAICGRRNFHQLLRVEIRAPPLIKAYVHTHAGYKTPLARTLAAPGPREWCCAGGGENLDDQCTCLRASQGTMAPARVPGGSGRPAPLRRPQKLSNARWINELRSPEPRCAAHKTAPGAKPLLLFQSRPAPTSRAGTNLYT